MGTTVPLMQIDFNLLPFFSFKDSFFGPQVPTMNFIGTAGIPHNTPQDRSWLWTSILNICCIIWTPLPLLFLSQSWPDARSIKQELVVTKNAVDNFYGPCSYSLQYREPDENRTVISKNYWYWWLYQSIFYRRREWIFGSSKLTNH